MAVQGFESEMPLPTAEELNEMPEQQRKAILEGDFGRALRRSAAEYITWIFWTRQIDKPTEVLNQGSAFILDRGQGPFLVTAAHVYRQYLADLNEHGALYCQVANAAVRDLPAQMIACGNIRRSLEERDQEPDIATFRISTRGVTAVGKRVLIAPVSARLSAADATMVSGFPGHERIFNEPDEISFGYYSALTPVTSATEHQITCRFDRTFWVDSEGLGFPPPGYDLGGMSGAPLLVPKPNAEKLEWGFGGVIVQAPEARRAEDVLFESVTAHHPDYIRADGTLTKSL